MPKKKKKKENQGFNAEALIFFFQASFFQLLKLENLLR